MSSTVNEKKVRNDHDLKAGKDGTKFRGGYRGTRAGKKVQAAKQEQKNKKQEQSAENTERNDSTSNKSAILLHAINAIIEECSSFTQSTVKPKNVSKGASIKADGRSYRGTRAGKRVKLKQNLKKAAMILNTLAKNV